MQLCSLYAWSRRKFQRGRTVCATMAAMSDLSAASHSGTVPAIRILFMGTPDFALPALEALHAAPASGGWQVVGVVTQPDRRAGRGKKLIAGPVKSFALERRLPLMQPERLRHRNLQRDGGQTNMLGCLRMLAPDLIVVAAYGQILPSQLLELPTFGCLNLHASLLPAYRGASPITAALLDGLDRTGVTIMLMDEGMDTGPVLAQGHLPIRASDTADALSQRLAARGADLLVDTIPRWLAGELAPVAQSELTGEPSVCRLVKKQDGLIDWTLPASRIERMVRAYAPWPAAYTNWIGQNFKLWQSGVMAGKAAPGHVVEIDGQVAVGTGDGLLVLHEVQPAGKKRMTAAAFLNGAPDFIGSRLGV